MIKEMYERAMSNTHRRKWGAVVDHVTEFSSWIAFGGELHRVKGVSEYVAVRMRGGAVRGLKAIYYENKKGDTRRLIIY